MKKAFSLFLTGIVLSAISSSLTIEFISNAQTTSNISNFTDGYSAKWISQTKASSDSPVLEHFVAEPGEEIEFVTVFENVGTKTWKNYGDEQVTFSVYKDKNVVSAPKDLGYDDPSQTAQFGKSYFQDSSWVSQYRMGTLKEKEVAPGERGTFMLKFKVPTDGISGIYREDISMATGPNWIANTVNGDVIGVAHIWVGIVVNAFCPKPDYLETYKNEVYGFQIMRCSGWRVGESTYDPIKVPGGHLFTANFFNEVGKNDYSNSNVWSASINVWSTSVKNTSIINDSLIGTVFKKKNKILLDKQVATEYIYYGESNIDGNWHYYRLFITPIKKSHIFSIYSELCNDDKQPECDMMLSTFRTQ